MDRVELEAKHMLNSYPIDLVDEDTDTDLPRLKIALISDFFYPRKGGAETHQYALGQELIRRGHKVIMVTDSYNNNERQGIRYMSNGIKVYYCPFAPIFDQNFLPLFWFFLPLLRNILIRECIDICHLHQAPSFMSQIFLIHCNTLNIPCIFTDHSLFGFQSILSINMNKVLKASLTEVLQVICVSHTSKENLCLRACLDPNIVNVIPNAVDTTMFHPSTDDINNNINNINITQNNNMSNNNNTITIVLVNRLAFRKGIDLLIEIIPPICEKFDFVRFLIGGDGPKRIELEEMNESFSLHERVILLGSIEHHNVRQTLIKGDIFLNCSLTEAFCIAIVEAASCGLYVVSTKVGGVPEVLPSYMISLSKPNSNDMIKTLSNAIIKIKNESIKIKQQRKLNFHFDIRNMYSWQSVAKRTQTVYYNALKLKYQNEKQYIKSNTNKLLHRLSLYYQIGPIYGKICAFIILIDHIVLLLCNIIWPKDKIEKAVDFIPKDFGKHRTRFEKLKENA